MAFLGNIIWFIFFGWWNFIVYAFLGLLFCITIIGIPIGKALFQYAKLMTLPFGKVIVRETDIKGKENVAAVRRVGGVIANIIWLPIGVVTFILNIGTMIVCAITIIGIPAAVVIARSCKFLLWPVGARVITKEQAETMRMEQSMIKVMGTAMAVNQSMMPAQNVAPQPIAQPVQNVMPSVPSAGQIPQQAAYSAPGSPQAAVGGGTAAVKSGIAAGAGLEGFLEKSEQVVNDLREKLLQNQTIAKLMPYLDYVAYGVLVLSVIVSLIPVPWIIGFLVWLLVVAAEGLEIIKGNRLAVLILLGGRLFLRIIGLLLL